MSGFSDIELETRKRADKLNHTQKIEILLEKLAEFFDEDAPISPHALVDVGTDEMTVGNLLTEIRLRK